MAYCHPAIEFEKEIYLPGEEITGRAWVSTTKDMKAKSVEITFTGKAVNAFKLGKAANVAKTGKKGEEVYVEMKHEVWAPENEENTFPAGDYEWKFSFELPKDCPPSFEGKNGFIRYSVLLHMDIPNWPEKNVERAVTVSPIIDLNTIAEAGEPTKMHLDSTVFFFNCFPCAPRRGSVIYELASPKLGYVSGETVIVNGAIQNNTSKPIRIIQAKLNRVVTYREELQGKNKKRNPADADGYKSRCERTVLETKIERCQIQPDETTPFEFSFVIPPVVATIRNSKCINVEYNVSIWADTGFCNKIEDASLNILVGNVPLAPSSLPSQKFVDGNAAQSWKVHLKPDFTYQIPYYGI
ncbi:unnamed protein product [Caenorhabditis nigoni]|nr:hypothetical protein B9Z55_006628 [Caenorhabditis nigoni]